MYCCDGDNTITESQEVPMGNGRGRLYLPAALCMLVALGVIAITWVQIGKLNCIIQATPLQQVEIVAKLLEFMGMDQISEGKFQKEVRDPCPSPKDAEGTIYEGSPQQGSMSPLPPVAAITIAVIAAYMIYRSRRRQPSEAW